MVGSQADSSSEHLKRFAAALRAFGGQGRQALLDLQGGFADRRRWLASCLDTAEREVERISEKRECAEDETREDFDAELDAASDRLETIRFWVQEVEDAHRQFVRDATRFKDLLDERLPRATAFLEEKVARLDDYSTVAADRGAESLSSVPPERFMPVEMPAAQPDPEDYIRVSVSEYRLPDGFRWVPLENIDEEALADLPDTSEFKKVDYDTMRAGCEALQREILPQMQSQAKCSAQPFREMDTAAGISYEHGKQRVYEAFFGAQDFIYFVKGKRHSQLDLINGHHRIRVLIDLGWKVFPAKVKE